MNDEEYRAWLVNHIDDGRALVYTELLSLLYETEFTWINQLDENRAADGVMLRGYFQDHMLMASMYDKPCCVLEMLIALAIKIETDLVSEPGEYEPKRWFWFMLDNLGLLPYVDSAFCYNEVVQILTSWMKKSPISGTTYGKSGEKVGKLFGEVGKIPMLFPVENGQNLQFWDQINRFLIENE